MQGKGDSTLLGGRKNLNFKVVELENELHHLKALGKLYKGHLSGSCIFPTSFLVICTCFCAIKLTKLYWHAIAQKPHLKQ